MFETTHTLDFFSNYFIKLSRYLYNMNCNRTKFLYSKGSVFLIQFFYYIYLEKM